ncbi:MAG TPA: glucose-6-phosphate isomerase [Hyphomonadaceae bacterium]|jgi:glucose-6-phosphate isomerase|nr:glucose-6-phosphate isomerase [Hyphomonadaceae bacterium]
MTLASWKKVEAEFARLHARKLQETAKRANLDAFIWKAPHLEADVAKQLIDEGAMSAMQAVADERGLKAKIADLFAGRIVNSSENRPALHWALRGNYQGIATAEAMAKEAEKAAAFAVKAARGGLGFPVKTILHVGIGGSDLGPRLIYDALRDYSSTGPEIRFAANVDPEDFAEATASVDPKTTLVLVVSKSFKTPETASNAQLAREWLVKHLGEADANNHLAAVSSAPDKAKAWGAAEDRIFPMDESVGGRYSVWSSVGLSLQIALGADVWQRFLKGAAEMDVHFRDTPPASNTPARLAMMDVFLHTAADIPSRTVLAYAHRLRKLPDFLQQLEMESNGKNASDGPGGLVGDTAPIVWGSVGTLGQHSFHQLLHQGARQTSIEFVAALSAGAGDKARGRALLSNAFAQAEGLLGGRSEAAAEKELRAKGVAAGKAKAQAHHMDMPGGRNSTIILLDDLSPESVGALIALYEHRTFAAGILWGINPFDHWGVELGKILAEQLDKAIAGADAGERDPSTLRLVDRARAKFKG